MNASQQDGTYPRPQLCRADWHSLDGAWDFALDRADVGLRDRWHAPSSEAPFDLTIAVPYPPESEASGIADRGPHHVLWYRRSFGLSVTNSLLRKQRRLLLHFGAVDYQAQVWIDGVYVGCHEGGQTPFVLDITDHLDAEDRDHRIIVRAQDDPLDTSQPRGKQTWLDEPSKVWYERSSGIWQTVWLEAVPATYVADLAWRADPDTGVTALIEAGGAIGDRLTARVTLTLAGRELGHATASFSGRRVELAIPMRELANGIDREDLVWSPENPVLIDATVALSCASANEAVPSMDSDADTDTVQSYFGIRKVSVGGGRFLLNNHHYFLRGILNQGYRPGTHLANRGTDELRAEIELAKSMGFNTMRIHQKAEDPRMLYWADRLGMLIWAETAATYEFTTTAVERLTAEWIALLRRDRSHPCIVTWVPVNESWGFPNLSTAPAQRSFLAAIAALTRALDPSRPVVSNEGWEHVDSDLLGVHDYTSNPLDLTSRYGDKASFAASLLSAGVAAEGRVIALNDAQAARFAAGDSPLIISEFGGLSLRSAEDAFAYTHVGSDTELAARLGDLFSALRSSASVAGFCYTQLMDTAQETNGLADEHGAPKLALDTIRYIVTGEKDQL